MRIILLYNPVSGAGRARRTAGRLSQQLGDAGHEVQLVETQLGSSAGWLDDDLDAADLLVVIGGDGAVRLGCDPACRMGTPLYHYAAGTENLFAREFGMRPTASGLLEAIGRGVFRQVDLADVNGLTFALMTSIGYDAEVVHDLASRRGGSISHMSYLGPMLRQLRRWRPPVVTITVDDETVVEQRPGFAVVANSRHYGFRLNPALRASMSDGLLDLAFFPTGSAAALVGWAARCRAGRQERHPALIYRRGARVEVACESPQRFQLDGDPPGHGGDAAAASRLSMRVRPSALRVLVGDPDIP